jgi:hypothetical protein
MGPWELPMPEGCVVWDWTGCTNVALRNALDRIPPEMLKRHLLEFMEQHPTTSNQRQLFSAVLMRCTDELIASHEGDAGD